MFCPSHCQLIVPGLEISSVINKVVRNRKNEIGRNSSIEKGWKAADTQNGRCALWKKKNTRHEEKELEGSSGKEEFGCIVKEGPARLKSNQRCHRSIV